MGRNKMPKKLMEEVFNKLSPPKEDSNTNMDNKQPIHRYIPCEYQKKGQPLLEECNQKFHPRGRHIVT